MGGPIHTLQLNNQLGEKNQGKVAPIVYVGGKVCFVLNRLQALAQNLKKRILSILYHTSISFRGIAYVYVHNSPV